MIEHRVEVTDSKGQSMKVLLRLTAGTDGRGVWQALDNGFVCYERGIADTGHYPTSYLAWVAMYGGAEVDDNKLVFHLDGFLSFTHANDAGKGWVYKQDYLLMEPGEVSWRLLD